MNMELDTVTGQTFGLSLLNRVRLVVSRRVHSEIVLESVFLMVCMIV